MNKLIDTIDHKIDSTLPQSPEAIRRRKNRILKPVAVFALAGSIFAGYKIAEHAMAAPHFSEMTKSYTVEPGNGLYDAVETIEGINSISKADAVDYVEQLPKNKDALEDGLQPGEQLVVPESVEK